MKSENKEKKEYLKRLRKLRQDIQLINLEIEDAMNNISMTPKLSDMPSGSREAINDISKLLCQMYEKESQLLKKKELIQSQVYEITDAIRNIDDMREREILILRYSNGISWDQIRTRVDYSEASVYRIHGQALQHFKINKDDSK